MSQRAVSCYIQNHHQKPMKLAYPDPSLSCNESLPEPTVTRQCIIEREPDWFNDIPWNTSCGCNGIPFPVTSEIYVFYKYLENASRNSLSLYLRCLLMVFEINKATMYLKIRSSFKITKKQRQNTPNVPELGGMTHICITKSEQSM